MLAGDFLKLIMLITKIHLFVELFSHVLKRGKQLANMHDYTTAQATIIPPIPITSLCTVLITSLDYDCHKN